MNDLLVFCLGLLTGCWGPPALVWVMTYPERKARRVRRASLQDMLSDLHRDGATGRWHVPTQRAGQREVRNGPDTQA